MTSLRPAAGVPPRRILVRGVNWLGDAVMTTPALQRLRAARPEAHITLLTHEKLSDLWLGHPSLDALSPSRPGKPLVGRAPIARLGVGDRPGAAQFTPVGAGSLAGADSAAGGPRAAVAQFAIDEAVAPRPGQGRMPKRSVREANHLVRPAANTAPLATTASPGRPTDQLHDYLHLAATLGADPEPLPPRLEILRRGNTPGGGHPPIRGAQQALDATPGKPLVFLGLNPGAEYGPAKGWPAASFAAAAREVTRRLGNRVWPAFGVTGDWALCDKVARRAGGGVFNLAGKTSLRQLMALLKLCRVVLTNDSGPMHVAAALGTPAVVPFGSTSPELTGPGLPGDLRHQLLRAAAPCLPCFLRHGPIDFRCA